jgi:hypothetical protein
MRKHIYIGLIAVILSACASHQGEVSRVPAAEQKQIQELNEHATMMDTAASGRGNSGESVR